MRDRPSSNFKLEWPGGVVPEWARPQHKNRHPKGGKHGAKGGGSKRERLQKVMAQSGYGSRRNIEILIAQGHITVNGQVAKLGDSVGPGDKVKLDGNLIHLRFGEQLPRVLIYNKPDNEIVTRDDPEKRATVFDRLPKVTGGRWVSVGRLDLNTGGLLLFTTNGDLANRLTHPRFEVEREYAVRLLGELTPEQVEKLTKTGVEIEGDHCTFDSIEDRGGEGANHWYHVVLREGKNREVRKMMEAVGMVVSRLIRVRFGNVTLPGHIKRGMYREMEEEQVQELLAFAGVKDDVPGEGERAPEEDDELDNIGNRVQPEPRRAQPAEIDDDFGNRAHHPAREADGNRGTYVPGAGGDRPPKRERNFQGKKAFGFKKRSFGSEATGPAARTNFDSRGNYSDNRGSYVPMPGTQPDPRSERNDQRGNRAEHRGGRGHGDNRGNHFDNRGNRADNRGNQADNRGNQADNRGNHAGGGHGERGAAEGQGNTWGNKGPGAHRKHGKPRQGKPFQKRPGGSNPAALGHEAGGNAIPTSGEKPFRPPQGAGPQGQGPGKPGRHRRHKNRHRGHAPGDGAAPVPRTDSGGGSSGGEGGGE